MRSSHAIRIVAVLLSFCATAAGAAPNPRSHVRSESRQMQTVLAEGVQQSPTISTLVDRIDASNVIVYVECARLGSLTLQGRTRLVAAKRDVRYVRVEVDCMLMRRELTTIIGHELQHAAEIAAAPDVVDERSYARLLQKIGFSTCCSTHEQYETRGALEAADRVMDEMLVHRVASIAGGLSR